MSFNGWGWIKTIVFVASTPYVLQIPVSVVQFHWSPATPFIYTLAGALAHCAVDTELKGFSADCVTSKVGNTAVWPYAGTGGDALAGSQLNELVSVRAGGCFLASRKELVPLLPRAAR